MSAPFAPPPPGEVKAIVLGILAIVVSVPFAKRDDWVGWIAFSTLAASAVSIWVLFIRGVWHNTIRWWRRRSTSD